MIIDTTWFLLIFSNEKEKVKFPKVGSSYTFLNTTHTIRLRQFCDDPWKMKLIQTDEELLWRKHIEKHKDKIVKAYIAVGYKNFWNRNFSIIK